MRQRQIADLVGTQWQLLRAGQSRQTSQLAEQADPECGQMAESADRGTCYGYLVSQNPLSE